MEVVLSDRPIISNEDRLPRQTGSTFHIEAVRVVCPAQWKGCCRSDRGDSWQGSNPFHQIAEERRPLRGLRIVGVRNRHEERQSVVGTEARVDLSGTIESVNRESSTNKQDERERD